MRRVYLGLGGNMGDRWAALRAAVEGLASVIEIDAVSPVYETPPAYVEDQPPFLNMALSGRADQSASNLLAEVKRLEAAIGRTPSVRYGPRLIDIDILFFGDEVIATDELQAPHPLLSERAFVLAPLADIAADLVHPVSRRTIADLLAALPGSSRRVVRRVGPLQP